MIVEDSYNSSVQESEAMSILAENLLKLKNEMVEFSLHQQPQSKQSSPTQSPELSPQQSPKSQIQSQVRAHYKQFSAKLPSSYKTMTYEDKIQYLLNQRQLGSLIHLFEIIYYFREALPQELLISVSDNLTQNLNFQSELEIRCMFELLAYIGVVDEIMIQNIYKLVLEESLPFDIGFLYLVNMGIIGFEILIEIAGGQFNGLPLEALNYLARSEIIIQQIIIPSVMNDLSNTSDPKRKTTALCILSKLYNLTSSPKVINKMVKLYQDQKQISEKNRKLIASILRSSGKQGEKQLIRMLKNNHNNKQKIPLVNVMSWKVPQESQLEIEVVEYTIASGFTPGSMYRYQGNVDSTIIGQVNKQSEGVLYLNSRDFLAALNRFIAAEGTETARSQDLRQGSFNCGDLSKLISFMKSREKKQVKDLISEDTMKSLHICLNNPILQIRQAALKSIGNIGLPQAADSIDRVVKCLSDPDSRNRSMACWTISKICTNPSQKIIKKLVELLKDSFWKVRNEACLTLAAVVNQPDEFLIGGLIKALKDGSINRQTVCETIIQLGPVGEQILVDLLKLTHPTDTKVISSIISSFSLANVESPAIDYLIQQLFKHCSHQNSSIRALCLQCLNHFRIKSSEGNVTYLKAKNILPLFYFFLEDPSQKLRDLAVDSILSFGSHAELIFIEGVTKSSNPVVRSECVKGLSQMGAQNFRAILFGLRDNDQRVRVATSNAILSYLHIQDVISQFQDKCNHLPTLCCHLTEILEGYTLGVEIQEYLYYLLEVFRTKKQEGKEDKKRIVNDQNLEHNY